MIVQNRGGERTQGNKSTKIKWPGTQKSDLESQSTTVF